MGDEKLKVSVLSFLQLNHISSTGSSNSSLLTMYMYIERGGNLPSCTTLPLIKMMLRTTTRRPVLALSASFLQKVTLFHHTHIGLNRSDTLDLINLTLTMHIKLLCMHHLYSTFSGLYDCTMCTDHRHD